MDGGWWCVTPVLRYYSLFQNSFCNHVIKKDEERKRQTDIIIILSPLYLSISIAKLSIHLLPAIQVLATTSLTPIKDVQAKQTWVRSTRREQLKRISNYHPLRFRIKSFCLVAFWIGVETCSVIVNTQLFSSAGAAKQQYCSSIVSPLIRWGICLMSYCFSFYLDSLSSIVNWRLVMRGPHLPSVFIILEDTA